MIDLRFFIVDDDAGIRAMLTEIIEDEDLGQVIGESNDGSQIHADLLNMKQIDILLIDLLMPERDGIETVREIGPTFKGKIIIISQVETKEMIGEAYSLGIEHYITKPLNRLEVKYVLQKVKQRLLLENSIKDIQKSLNVINHFQPAEETQSTDKKENEKVQSATNLLLSELGIICEGGSKDIADILQYLYESETKNGKDFIFPSLKELFSTIAVQQLGETASPSELQREVKASEQRVRRAIHQAVVHIASLGLTDYTNPKFENYASKFFDYTQVRMTMLDLEEKPDANSHTRVNVKKFVQALYLEVKQMVHH